MFTSLSRYMRVRKGITLAELMLVIAVIALLAAVIYPASAWYMSRARDSDRKNDVQNAAIHLSNFFTDYRSYPEPDETGCLAPDVFRGTTYKNILLESAPKGNTVDSSNPCVGKYAYGTSTGDTAYILVAYLENKYAGNYSGSTQGMLGRGRVTRQWWENAQAAQSSGSVQGDKFVYSAGVFQDAPMVFADGACQQTHRWVLFSMNHGEEKIESITDVTSPANGGTTYTVKATCTNAALTLEETSLIRCNDNYVLSQGGCIAQVTDCPSKIVESFSVPALAHGSSTGVTATVSLTGGTITHTATASCDNGTVNIEGQNSIVACNEGYIPTAGQCVFTQNTCDSQTKDGFPVPALAHGSSTGVTATESMTGGTITHTANASCDNGTVNIKDQTSTVECNEGYKEDETTSPHSCKEVPGFTTVWNIGWATSGVNNTISFRIATHSGATVTIYGNNGVKLATSTGGVVTLSGTGLANGENRIRIVGDLAQFSTHAFPSTAYALKKVTDWGGVKWKSMKNMFYGAANLVTLPTEAPDLNSVTDMWGMFYYATSFNQPLNSWNVSNVTNMNSMFVSATSFNQALNNWDVSKVTNMSSMFYWATSFNQPLNSWNTSKVTKMNSMFVSATAFNRDINSWNVSKVTDMSSMFYWATSFNQPIGNWNVSKVTDMREMFAYASTFDQNIHSWCADKIPSKPEAWSDEYWDNEAMVTYGNSWVAFDDGTPSGFHNQAHKQPQWWGCVPPGFTTMWKVGTTGYGNGDHKVEFAIESTGPVTIYWGDGQKTENATTGTHSHTYTTAGDKTVKISGPLTRFYNPTVSLSSPTWNAHHFGKLTAVTDWGGMQWTSMDRMFAYANKLNALPTEAPDLNSVTDMYGMFSNATSFNQPLNSWNVSNVTNMREMFSNATAFNQPLNSWNVSKVTNMGGMFASARSFNQPLNSWNVSKVTDMWSMFSHATSFNQPLNSWNVSKVTKMNSMFHLATSFNQPIGNWNVSKVTDMSSMFYWATSFNQPIGNWNVSKVTKMNSMFHLATSFNQPIGNWDVSKVTSMYGMFSSATSFNQPLNSWNVSKVTDMREMFAHASTFDQNIHSWCADQISYKPEAWYEEYWDDVMGMMIYGNSWVAFDDGTPSGFRNQAHKQPQWWGCVMSGFTTKWKIGAGYETRGKIEFEIEATGPVTIDWGDGTKEVINDSAELWNHEWFSSYSSNIIGTASHVYTTDGEKIVKISGPLTRFWNENYASRSVPGLIAVTDWGEMQWTSMENMFRNANNFESVPLDTPILTHVTNMSGMFHSAWFNQNINHWDVSNITDMSYMFSHATSFNQPLNDWDVSGVKDMGRMFKWASSFNQDIGNWKVNNVTDMREMFAHASTFDQNIHSWCADKIPSKPSNFDAFSHPHFMSQNSKQPQWWGCKPFTTTWKVGATGYGNGDRTIQFAIASTGPVKIDWGDGTIETKTSGTYSHTYATAGDKTVKISGPLTRWYNPSWSADHFGKLTAVTDWGGIHWASMERMFAYANKLNTLPTEAPDLSNVTDMREMFASATAFNQPLNSWNTSKVTDMWWMFWSATSFNQPLNNWNVSNVTNMYRMFESATAFNQPLNSWNTSKVTKMNSMFSLATSFNQPIGNWDVSKVTNMSTMFYSATAFNQPIGNWNVSNVTNMYSMFESATAFNQPLNSWNTSKVTKMNSMFSLATSFNQPLNSWNTSKVTNMAGMFSRATSFNQPIGNWNVSNVTYMSSMFYWATSFNQPLNSWNTSKVTDMWWMFWSATSFNQPIGNWNVSNVTNMYSMFESATAFNQPLNSWNTSKVTKMNSMFSLATSFNQPLNSWNTSKVTDMAGMFSRATSFNQPIGNWNVSNVTYMQEMFAYASRFNQNIRSWCIPHIASKPLANPAQYIYSDFDTGTPSGFRNQAHKQPRWGCTTP